MNAITLQGVRRSFGSRQVLGGVTAAARSGAVVGLLGKNGEGKTTLFKILLDMLASDAGAIEVLGLRPDGSGAIRQGVGYVPERPVFHDFMSVGEVLALRQRFMARWSGDKALALAKTLELDLETPIRGASKGTLGKLAWVCAAAHDPALFLLDEPTSGLDALVRDDILAGLVGELHESGKTILVANHRMDELAGVLDEVWVLAGGVIAGVYDVDTLRREACLVTGRLKEGRPLPVELPLVALPARGPVGRWAAFERAHADRLCASGLLENPGRESLPLEAAFKLLLKDAEGEPR